MKNNARASWFLSASAVCFVAASAAAQTVVYDNTSGPLNKYFASSTEFGDEIHIDGGGWIADTFRFEYFASGLSGGETAFVRFYRNDGVPVGPGIAPGGLIYQSPSFPVINGNLPITITDLAPLNIQLPNNFTWTVKVSGLTGGETFGLNLYDAPNPGSSLDDIWQFGPDGWELKQIPGSVANFGAYLTAVPEPSAVTLLAVGGLALALRRRRTA